MLTVEVMQKVEIDTLKAKLGVRYWEDGSVNGIEGKKPPFIENDMWVLKINLDTGFILDWPKGITVKCHYKVCDDGVYSLYKGEKEIIPPFESYVPSILYPNKNGYGDYVILEIDENGFIKNWNCTQRDILDLLENSY